MNNPVGRGKLRILNQFTEQFTVNELAERVRDAARSLGLEVRIQHIANPRKELEEHYYNAKNSGLIELGLKPNLMSEQVITDMLKRVSQYKDAIDTRKILPRVAWNAE